jgi:transcriptional regulator with XRE-family HTH domain
VAKLRHMRSAHTPAYKAFLVRLRAARLKRGLTQAEVAKALKVPQSQISRMESGETRVDVVEAAAFAKLYGRRLTWFVPDC